MLKKLLSVILAVSLCGSFTLSAFAAFYGFEGAGGPTETQNEYFFDGDNVLLIENKESITGFLYDEIHAGSYILLPLMVYVNGGKEASAVTDKMIKNDSVTFSYKVMKGGKYVEEPSVVDGKKLKIPGVSAGAYIKIPFGSNYASLGKTDVSVQLVLAVNGVTYQYTQTTLKCRLSSYVTSIRRNSIYGAKNPTVFKADKYSGEASFDFGNDVKYTAKVKKGGVYFLNLSREPNADIVASNPGAALEFYSFSKYKEKPNKFSSTGKLEIPVKVSSLSKKGVSPSLYVYRVDGNVLTALAAGTVSFDKNAGRLTINTSTLDSYVLSNQPLNRDVTPAESDILKSGYAPVTPAA